MQRLVLIGVLMLAIGDVRPASAQPVKFLDKSLDDWVAELGHKDARARRSAAFALGTVALNTREAASPVKALEKAVRSPKDGGDANPAVRQNAAWALGRLQPASAIRLAAALEDDDALVRRDAAAALDQVT